MDIFLGLSGIGIVLLGFGLALAVIIWAEKH